ncbi:MAG: deoxyribodipyrimidine photo-lyase [Alphaproteobacteria bacterium]|nr:deoxyribodipyrimidine photo-lyase [Alphaproteobacteria bacterium]
MNAMSPAVVWFRLDLRLTDNGALLAALERGEPILPLFILDDVNPGSWAPGDASRWWLHHSLAALDQALAARGSALILRRGNPLGILSELIEDVGAGAVYWNRCYEPWAQHRDTEIKAALKDRGLTVQSFDGHLLREPWTIKTGAGKPYTVFTPFWKALQASGDPPRPKPAPDAIPSPKRMPASDSLDAWGLLPKIPWDKTIRASWTPGEEAALARLDAFLDEALGGYDDERDRPDHTGTSRLSPHLHFGEISPRTVWHRTLAHVARVGDHLTGDAMSFLRELAWRDFSYNLLHHFPDLPERNLKSNFDAFPWAEDDAGLKAWQKGRTGYPIVDAGMRELWHTGWMHNRVRMITASFLIKDLLLPWQVGEAWFWDTLVDADLASNSASWQWVAGSGADAAPYFRIFNPVLQGQKFDPDGAYVRKWVPELADLPDKFLHAPWQAPDAVLKAAGITLGKTYPAPIVDHAVARNRALAAYETIKSKAA